MPPPCASFSDRLPLKYFAYLNTCLFTFVFQHRRRPILSPITTLSPSRRHPQYPAPPPLPVSCEGSSLAQLPASFVFPQRSSAPKSPENSSFSDKYPYGHFAAPLQLNLFSRRATESPPPLTSSRCCCRTPPSYFLSRRQSVKILFVCRSPSFFSRKSPSFPSPPPPPTPPSLAVFLSLTAHRAKILTSIEASPPTMAVLPLARTSPPPNVPFSRPGPKLGDPEAPHSPPPFHPSRAQIW